MITTVNLFDRCNLANNPEIAYKNTHTSFMPKVLKQNGVCWYHPEKPKLVEKAIDGKGMFDLFTAYGNQAWTWWDNIDNIIRCGDYARTNIKVCMMREARSCNPLIYKNFELLGKDIFDIFDLIYTHDRFLLESDARYKFRFGTGNYVKNPGLYKKTKLVSMVSRNTKAGLITKERYDTVMKYKDLVDWYGKGHNFVENIEDAHKDYMFSLVLENEKADYAYSEKIMNCFVTGTIPVYLGSKIPPPIGLDTKGIIYIDENFNLNELNEKLYYNLKNSVIHNFKIAMKYQHPMDYTFGEGGFADEWLDPIRRQHANT